MSVMKMTRGPLALGAASLALLLSGCGATTTTSTANPFVTTATLSGKLHGGNQPVVGATVSLYAVGTTGYGSAATLYAQTTTVAYGSFSFNQTAITGATGAPSSITSSYACPTGSTTNPDPQMYLIAKGGETQGTGNGNNSAAAFIIAIGKCSTAASANVDMNEVTSVATMAALQQYFNPVTESLGYASSTQSQQGYVNGLAAITNLADVTAGTAKTSVTLSATPTGSTNAVTVTATPEFNQVNLLANILAACVNTTSNTSTNCGTLFTNAVAPSASVTSQPSADYSSINATNEDVVQALYFMLTNPAAGGSASSMNALYALVNAQAPFQPYYTTAPTDWTVAISYASASTCTVSSGTTSTQKFLTGVNAPAIDAQGNVWAASVGTGGGLFEISPNGTPLTCALGATVKGTSPAAIDINGNVWVGSTVAANSSYNLYKWNSMNSALESTWPIGSTAVPSTLATDGNGNVFYATTGGVVGELVSAATSGAPVTAAQTLASLGSSRTFYFMQADASGNLWIPDVTASNPSSIFELFSSTNTSGSTYENGYETSTISSSNLYFPYGIAVGQNMVYSSNGAGSGSPGVSYRWSFITPDSSTHTASVTTSSVELGGNYSVRGVAVDGANNVWQANNNPGTGNWVTGTSTGIGYGLAEISAAGNAISATSASGTGAYGTNTGGFQKPSPFFSIGARGPAIDSTGNVWVGQNSASAANITEYIGAAVPVMTPLAAAAQSNLLGQKP
ncbi:hypothetical protein ACFQBQ_13525 [Granulicella cerasi]|uniref:Uncharacterized protein n=1 Tax=Granulicella cerasi TaxID=741063 RepID=A0ABW1ZAX5_9BACT|nr:hypothetical protein [Granulicella cerasi]